MRKMSLRCSDCFQSKSSCKRHKLLFKMNSENIANSFSYFVNKCAGWCLHYVLNTHLKLNFPCTTEDTHTKKIETAGLKAAHHSVMCRKSGFLWLPQFALRLLWVWSSFPQVLPRRSCRRLDGVDAMLATVGSCFWLHFAITVLFLNAIKLKL